jgi:AraC family transcriptional regulator
MTVKEVGEKRGIGSRMVTLYCITGRIKGTEKAGNMWLLPKGAEKSEDGRYKRVIKNEK